MSFLSIFNKTQLSKLFSLFFIAITLLNTALPVFAYEEMGNNETYSQYILSIPISATSSDYFLIDQVTYQYSTSTTANEVVYLELEYPFTITLGTTSAPVVYSENQGALDTNLPFTLDYSSLPTTVNSSALPAVSYPYATSTATTTLNTLTSATTTEYTTYTPFMNYSLDSRGTVSTYFTFNGNLVGSYSYELSNPTNGKLTYTLTNYLGTPTIQTDQNGDIIEMDITDTYGNYIHRDERNDNAYHNKGYTGHEYDDVTNLTYAHARYLDTGAHSFLSVDPMIYSLPQSYLYDPQQMNSYAYARNNPIVYTDPTGLVTASSFAGFVGGTALNTLSSLVSFVSSVSTAQKRSNTAHSLVNSLSSYMSRSTPSSLISDIRSSIGSGKASLVSAYNTNTLSTGFEAGMGTAGTIAGTVATAAFGGAVARTGAAVAGETVGGGVLRGAANPVVAEAAAYGRGMHTLYKADIANKTTLRKEFGFENGLRADFVDMTNKTIYELKPNNSRAINQEYKQLEAYRQQMFKETGEWYNTVLDTYNR